MVKSAYSYTHRSQWLARGENNGPCTVPGCDKDPCVARGMCSAHYYKFLRWGNTEGKAGEPPHRRVNTSGYVEVYELETGRYKLEHRALIEKRIGRSLLPHENVHHINGDRQDNRIENLELWSSSQPAGQRVKDKAAWAREIILLYGD